MAANEATKLELLHFDGSNFTLWKMKMHAVLVKDGCAVALLGAENRPKEMTEEEFAQKDELAMANIHLSLEDLVLLNVRTEISAKGLWDKLQNIYGNTSLLEKVLILKQLRSLKMTDEISVQEHLNRFNSLMSQLTDAGFKVGEEVIAGFLLCTMPNYWDFMMTSFSHGESLDMDNVIPLLLTEELRRKRSLTSPRGRAVVQGRSIDRDCGGRTSSRTKPSKDDAGDSRSESGSCRRNIVRVPTLLGDSVCLSAVEEGKIVNQWILHSGASFHMTPNREWFHTYKPCNGKAVYMADKNDSQVVGVGEVRIKMFNGCIRTFADVRHVPQLELSVLSVAKFVEQGLEVNFGNYQVNVVKGNKVVAKAALVDNLYQLIGETLVGEALVICAKSDSPTLWHKRLGHISEWGLQVLSKRNLLPGLKSASLDFCQHCLLPKRDSSAFPVSTSNGETFLDLVHAETCKGPTTSLGGNLYFVTFVDDFSQRVWVYVLERKSDVLNNFELFKMLVERCKCSKIKCLQTGNGAEFRSKDFEEFCSKHGIIHRFRDPGTPLQNTVGGRMSSTLLEHATSMLSTAKLEKGFWGEAIMYACYLVNMSPLSSLDMRTPQEVWSGKPIDYSVIRVFGCVAYVWIPEDKRAKEDRNSKRCILTGYIAETKEYKLWDPTICELILSKKAVFDEDPYLSNEK